MTEQLPYSVIGRIDGVEIRRYPEHVLVRTREQGDFGAASYRAFNPLFQYISGNNAAGARIAMTAPVLQEEISAQQHDVSFVMPQAMSAEKVPTPNDPRLDAVPVDAYDAAVLSFRGTWSERNMHEQAEVLRRRVEQAGLKTAGTVMFARFDPPWKPWFLKHNEAILRLAEHYRVMK